MSETDPKKTAKQSRADDVRTKIAAVAANATATDRRIVTDILTRAATGEYGSSTFDITPGVAALLFLEHNPHNRDFDPGWALELARRQRAGIWRKNNEPPGFYKDGALADAQHRLAATALSGVTWTTVIVFGMDRDAITTVDAGRRRDAASALKMDGVQEAKLKQQIIKATASYLLKRGDEQAALRSEVEIADAVHAHQGVLDLAINIAETSAQNLVNPVLRTPIAAAAAYLMLTATPPWPEQRVREKMALFQTGQSSAGESEPTFIAGQIIEKARTKTEAKDRLSTAKEIGLVLHALALSEQGVRASKTSTMKAAIKAELPRAGYPDLPMQEAAE